MCTCSYLCGRGCQSANDLIFEVIAIFLKVISYNCYPSCIFTTPGDFFTNFAKQIIDFWLDKIQNNAKVIYLWKSNHGHTTVKDWEAGHLRVKGPWARIYWSFRWPVCLKLQTSTLSCCMKSRKARNLVWFSLDEWFSTWPQFGNNLETGHKHIYQTITYTIIIMLMIHMLDFTNIFRILESPHYVQQPSNSSHSAN